VSYFLFLFFFLGIPLMIISFLTWRDHRKGEWLPDELTAVPFWIVLVSHVLVAVVYTTPWDNYLVKTGVWFYNPDLVTGITLGWVPIEEYTFFVLQTLWVGLLLRWSALRVRLAPGTVGENWRYYWAPTLGLGLIWSVSVGMLASGWEPGTYLALILAWGIPPVMLQFAFGGDILWRNRRLLAPVLLFAVAYLSISDSLAISNETWTIDPSHSLNILLGGVLPVEEFLFFGTTNVLIVLGMTLVLSKESHLRLAGIRRRLSRQPDLKALPGAENGIGKFIHITHLSKGYQEGKTIHPILKDVSVEIAQGEFIAILGKSGSGKSTLLNLISGIDRVDEGEIWFQNLNLTGLDELRRTLFRREKIGFIFQFFNLIPTLTVWENVILPLELDGKGNAGGYQKAEALLSEVGLLDRKDAFPDLLSGGEQQRVAIARALVNDPVLVLADEPTGNLDDETGSQVLSLLDRLTRRAGKNLILVTHSQEAANYADQIYYLRDGKLSGL
jgi:putative ABC transport system ATP-binding protein